jgi:hypothetical protein
MIIITFPFHCTVGVTIGIVTKHQAMFDESKLSSSFCVLQHAKKHQKNALCI